MKHKYIILGVASLLATALSARTFNAGEEIYVNIKQDYDWSIDNAKIYLYLFEDPKNE